MFTKKEIVFTFVEVKDLMAEYSAKHIPQANSDYDELRAELFLQLCPLSKAFSIENVKENAENHQELSFLHKSIYEFYLVQNVMENLDLLVGR
jgi:hypothetical protein